MKPIPKIKTASYLCQCLRWCRGAVSSVQPRSPAPGDSCLPDRWSCSACCYAPPPPGTAGNASCWCVAHSWGVLGASHPGLNTKQTIKGRLFRLWKPKALSLTRACHRMWRMPMPGAITQGLSCLNGTCYKDFPPSCTTRPWTKDYCQVSSNSHGESGKEELHSQTDSQEQCLMPSPLQYVGLKIFLIFLLSVNFAINKYQPQIPRGDSACCINPWDN